MTVNLENFENTNVSNNSEESEIKALVEKNIELSNEILLISKKTRSILMWQNIFGFLKVLLILIPLIIGFLYLPPILDNVIKSYREALGIREAVDAVDAESIKNTPSNIWKSLTE